MISFELTKIRITRDLYRSIVRSIHQTERLLQSHLQHVCSVYNPYVACVVVRSSFEVVGSVLVLYVLVSPAGVLKAVWLYALVQLEL